MNLCFDAVDLQVVRGNATQSAVRGIERPLDYANLLEQVGALAGLARGVGIGPGRPVGIALDDPFIELLTLLACARLGAPAVSLDAGRLAEYRPELVVTSRHLDLTEHQPATMLLHGVEPIHEQRDLPWEFGMRAGLTDPAGCERVDPQTVAFVHEREVLVAEAAADTSRFGTWLRLLGSGDGVDLAAAG